MTTSGSSLAHISHTPSWAGESPSHEEETEILKCRGIERLGSDVGQLFLGVDLLNLDLSSSDCFFEMVVFYVDVFRSWAQLRCSGEFNGPIVILKCCASKIWFCISKSRDPF